MIFVKLRSMRKIVNIIENGVKTTGSVTSAQKTIYRKNYRRIIKFSILFEVEYQHYFIHRDDTKRYGLKQGDKVIVYYMKDDPEINVAAIFYGLKN